MLITMATAKAFQDSGQPNVSLTNVSVPLSLRNPFSVYHVKLGKQLRKEILPINSSQRHMQTHLTYGPPGLCTHGAHMAASSEAALHYNHRLDYAFQNRLTVSNHSNALWMKNIHLMSEPVGRGGRHNTHRLNRALLGTATQRWWGALKRSKMEGGVWERKKNVF